MEANRETISVYLEDENSPLKGGIQVDIKKFPYMTNLPRISQKALSLGLGFVVLNTHSLFPLTLQTIINGPFPLVNKSLGRTERL